MALVNNDQDKEKATNAMLSILALCLSCMCMLLHYFFHCFDNQRPTHIYILRNHIPHSRQHILHNHFCKTPRPSMYLAFFSNVCLNGQWRYIHNGPGYDLRVKWLGIWCNYMFNSISLNNIQWRSCEKWRVFIQTYISKSFLILSISFVRRKGLMKPALITENVI